MKKDPSICKFCFGVLRPILRADWDLDIVHTEPVCSRWKELEQKAKHEGCLPRKLFRNLQVVGEVVDSKGIGTKMAKIVDEYSIALGPSQEFPTVLLTVKLDDGSVEGPFEFAPAYAHILSDELCVASARAAKKVTSGE